MVYDHFQDVTERFPDEVHKLLMPDDYTVKMAERAKAGKKAFEKIQIVDQSMMNELGGRLGDQSRQGDENSGAAASLTMSLQ